MRRRLLEYVVCPHCRDRLELLRIRREMSEILEGQIGCRGCRRTYLIEDGLLYLVPDERMDYCRAEDSAHERLLESNNFFDWVKDDVFYNWPHQLAQGLNEELRNEIISHSRSFLRVIETLKGDETILDFGAGFGWASRDLSLRGCYTIALDISPYMLRKAGEYLRRFQIHFDRVVSDIENLPFRDGAFDVVFGAAAIHHACNLEKTIGEFARVTRDCGRIITIKDHLRPLFQSLEEWKEGDRDTSFGINENSFNYLTYLQAFLSAGLWPTTITSRHDPSEKHYRARIGVTQNPVTRSIRALKFWLGNHAFMDIFARNTGRRLWHGPTVRLLKGLNQHRLLRHTLPWLASLSSQHFDPSKPFHIAQVKAASANVRRETVYKVEIVSKEAEDRLCCLSFDVYPMPHGQHPDRHVGYWAKSFSLKPGRQRVWIKFDTVKLLGRFRLSNQYAPADHCWQGNFFTRDRLYQMIFSVFDEAWNEVDSHTILQRILPK
jgi:SAM-dependent methyltransferase